MDPAPTDKAFARSFAIRVGLFFGGYLALNGVAMPYFPLWLAHRGFNEFQIALCLGLPQLTRIFLQPAGLMVVDRAPNRRFAILIFTILSTAIFIFAGPAEGFWPILAVSVAAFTVWFMVLPPTEALALTGVRQFGLDYGRMRLVGSAGFILTNLCGGLILTSFAPSSVYWMILGLMVLAAALALLLPVTPPIIRKRDDALRPKRRPAREVLRERGILVVMLVNGLVQASHSILYGFGSLYWEALRLSSVQIGILWAVGVLTEISLFAFSRAAVRRIGAFGLLAIGASAAVLRWVLFPLAPDFLSFLPLQVLHGASFGATFLGLQFAIVGRVSDEMTASAQAVAYMFTAVMMALGTFLAGPLYRALGGEAFFVMIIPAGVALALLVLRRDVARAPQ